MASAPLDPLQALSAALAVPADSLEQAELLGQLRDHLEVYPGPIPILCTTLVKTVSGAGDSLLKRWVLDLLQFAICRSPLSPEARTQLASQSLDTLAGLLHDANPHTVKTAVSCFATVYALLFRLMCQNRNMRREWDVLALAKTRILEFVAAPHTPSGVRFAAVKFMQRVILVQTRGVSDPRLQNKNDPNLAMCPSDHPYIPVGALEAEAVKLLETVITILYTSNNPDLLSAILNSWANLVKQRPALVELVVSTLAQWTPAKLDGLPPGSVKSVEKGVRILLTHISRSPQGAPFNAQIHAALQAQAARMEAAARRAAEADASRKRAPSAPAPDAPESKRVKTEPDGVPAAPAAASLASFDFSVLPASLVTDLVIANLQAISENTLIGLVQAYRHKRTGAPTPAPAPGPVASTSAAAPAHATPVAAATPPPARGTPDVQLMAGPQGTRTQTPDMPAQVKEEPVDPLKMDIDEEEIEYEPDRLNLELSGGQEGAADEDAALEQAMEIVQELDLSGFELPPPKALGGEERAALVRGSLGRIWDGAQDLQPADRPPEEAPGASASDLWMLLVVRLVTRPTDTKSSEEMEEDKKEDAMEIVVPDFYSRQDRLRQTLCDYIMADFSGRVRLATTWMNEEWYNDRIQMQRDHNWQPNYETWLNQIVAAYQTHVDGKDRAFSRFLLDLPSVPTDIMNLLRESCVETDRRQLGFAALREFVVQRPSLRAEAMNMLLELTTHPDKVTRGAAINTVKRWIPDIQPMDNMIREFALQLLRRLQSRPDKGKAPQPKANSDGPHDENMEDGQLPQEDIIQTPYLPEQLELPTTNAQVLQHVELLFALSTKVPEFLDEIFAAYGGMEQSVQETIQHLVTPLVRALGASHGKLLTLLRTFPPGADTLALRVLNIFTEHGRPSTQLVTLVKSLLNERDLDPRFLVPIIAEMDKADIRKYLPRIVSILNGQPDPKNLVRSVFSSVVATPPQTFGTVTSNLPRVRHSELLTPGELMVLLHESEKEIGLKAAIEAISICFSMTDIFRSEVIAAVLNQLVDEPTLPTLFLRTVIQAVTTYRSLVPSVSTTLLTRLITKKIWTNPPLWEGFARCAKLLAPNSFGALLQLPREQLRELVEKQPSLKAGLREYVMKRPGNKARVAGLLDIFGEDDGGGAAVDAPGGAGSGVGSADSAPAPEIPPAVPVAPTSAS